jgi:hypothetical protein
MSSPLCYAKPREEYLPRAPRLSGAKSQGSQIDRVPQNSVGVKFVLAL